MDQRRDPPPLGTQLCVPVQGPLGEEHDRFGAGVPDALDGLVVRLPEDQG